jgi:predicted N-formylglutamate amidohydrolase
VFSALTRTLAEAQRRELLRTHHAPHRAAVRRLLRTRLRRRALQLHVAVHSFVPVWKGRERRVDIGLLMDPSRSWEVQVVRAWRRRLRATHPELRIRLNAPYRGWTDGLATALRRSLGPRYVGIELEMNQALLRRGPGFGRRLQRDLASSLETALDELSGT